jgi:hypothetical protein
MGTKPGGDGCCRGELSDGLAVERPHIAKHLLAIPEETSLLFPRLQGERLHFPHRGSDQPHCGPFAPKVRAPRTDSPADREQDSKETAMTAPA